MENKRFKLYLDLRKKIKQYQHFVRFKCLRCIDGCCEHNIEKIPILKEDVKLLKSKGTDLDGIRSFNNSAYSLQRNNTLSHCYYLDKENHACTIHKYKPIYCLSYPFTFKLKEVQYLGKIVDDYNKILFPNPYCAWIKACDKDINFDNEIAREIRNLIDKM